MLATTHSERIGYPTQKPLALLDRIINRLRKKGKALSRSVLSLNCLGGIRHGIGQFD